MFLFVSNINASVINPDYSQVKIKNKTETTKFVPKESYISIGVSKKAYGPRYIKYNSKELLSKAKCSCGRKSYNKFYKTKYKNYCPFCKKNGVMTYRNHYEGEWTCKKCKADFCLADGKEKLYKARKTLTKIK